MKKFGDYCLFPLLGLSLAGGISVQAKKKFRKKAEVTIYLVRHGKTFSIQRDKFKDSPIHL